MFSVFTVLLAVLMAVLTLLTPAGANPTPTDLTSDAEDCPSSGPPLPVYHKCCGTPECKQPCSQRTFALTYHFYRHLL